MSAADGRTEGSGSARWGWAAGVALVVVVGGVLAGRAALDSDPEAQGQPRPMDGMEEMEGMEGEMSGMDMGGMSGMDGQGSIRLTPEQIRTFGVTFDSAAPRLLEERIRTVGIVDFDETRLSEVTTKFDGYVERLHVDFTGSPVRRGEPLAEIYSPELVAAQEELLLAAALEDGLAGMTVPGIPARSSELVDAARRRLRLWDISDGQIDGILEEGEPRRTLTLHAPVTGVVVEKDVRAGQAIRAGRSLYTIADLSEVWIEAEIREADAALVQEGDSATVEFRALPGRPLRGQVEYVDPTLEPRARSLKARISLPNPEGRLKPGMYATVRIRGEAWTALAVPTSSVLDTGERRLVFVAADGDRLSPREIRAGRTAGDWTEVLAGLEPGDRVVTSALYLLDSESNLAETMRSMMGMMNMSDMGSMDGMDGMDGMEMDGMSGMDTAGGGMDGMEMPREER